MNFHQKENVSSVWIMIVLSCCYFFCLVYSHATVMFAETATENPLNDCTLFFLFLSFIKRNEIWNISFFFSKKKRKFNAVKGAIVGWFSDWFLFDDMIGDVNSSLHTQNHRLVTSFELKFPHHDPNTFYFPQFYFIFGNQRCALRCFSGCFFFLLQLIVTILIRTKKNKEEKTNTSSHWKENPRKEWWLNKKKIITTT